MQIREIFKCNVCGNVVELLQAGAPALVCCGQDMEKLEAQTEDAANEKHVPIVKEVNSGIEVTVGSTLHPMEEDHLIRFIEVLTEDKVLRTELEAGQKPIAKFNIDKSEVVEVREFCNVHGLWKV
ncbi:MULTISPECIES: desulfoferrodoxin [unclassified Candidatus Frackibacter]|uniref:desulfoferrodoxin n=1 Tax=unclassified Candidatus Frackibacter TaxID=2648818 RepID=UPI00088FE173|nr:MULTISPECIES: desulfoferrodoxin [unclassified Candidatus Frackibacter]SDC62107.1 superoxide reductase [Candidatus Frackibacter sp. WG11]SEM75886.1 superoxide reductase [Candidatus Frackibacter sp. WG12]SFL86484.1 superoxide reductase [Candidatus Frackibacter sp. WG13]